MRRRLATSCLRAFVPSCLLAIAPIALAQSLDERLDEDAFLRGLTDLQLSELLEHYIRTNPPADPGQSAGYQIAMARMLMSTPGTTAEQRCTHVERLLEIRDAFIAGAAGDPRRPVWRADQAADLLFEVWARGGLGDTVLLGLPSDAQRAEAAAIAKRMHDETSAAEVEIDDALLTLERNTREEGRVERRQLRGRLAREQRDRRIPFLHGVASLLVAETAGADARRRREMLETALVSLEPVIGRLDPAMAARAGRYAGWAALRLDDPERARRLLTPVAGSDAASVGDRFAARCGLAAADGATDPAAAATRLAGWGDAYATVDELFYRVLLADQEFAWRMVAARRADAGRRDGLMVEAFNVYLALLDLEVAVAPASLRAITFARVSRAASDDLPLDRLPTLVTVARADHLARDAATRDTAISLFEHVLGRSDLVADDRAAALYGLATALHRSGRTRDAIDRYVAVAEHHASDPQAERAIESAATLAAGLHQKMPGNASVRSVLRHVLDVLLDKYVNLATVERWRYHAGRLALGDGEFGAAAAHFEQVTRDAPQWLDSRFMLANTYRTRARAAEGLAERQTLATETLTQCAAAREALQGGLARTTLPKRRAEIEYYLGYLRVFEGQSHLMLLEPQAAIDVLQEPETDDPIVLSARLQTRIDAWRAMDRPRDAVREVQAFVEDAPDQVGSVIPPLLAALQTEVEALLDISRDEEAVEKAREELVPLADMLDAWLPRATLDPDDAVLVRRAVADSYRHAEQFSDALRHYDTLLRDHPNTMQFILGRAECLYGLGDQQIGEAMRLFKRIGAIGPESGGDAYWLAQLRMLQILDRVNRNTSKIGPRIERLRQEDPSLGGERFRRGFEALQSKHG